MPPNLAETVDSTLSDWMAQPEADWLCPAALRLARRVPRLQPTLDRLLLDPVQRGLAGLGPPPVPGAAGDLGQRILSLQALTDGGGSPPLALARALEAEAQGDPRWWVPAARLHVLASEERERSARMALSDQDLPYVYPGELHPLMVEVLAVGDRVLTALHVDWMRKLTAWAADVLVLDVRQLGLWFWPQLRYLSERRLSAPLASLERVRRGQPGSRGLVLAYQARIGKDPTGPLQRLDGADRFIAALAVASERPTEL